MSNREPLVRFEWSNGTRYEAKCDREIPPNWDASVQAAFDAYHAVSEGKPVTAPLDPMAEAVDARITAYLVSGGLFNPEAANHDAVRDLLMDARAALARPSDDTRRLDYTVIRAWADRHGIEISSATDLRCAIEDARSLDAAINAGAG